MPIKDKILSLANMVVCNSAIEVLRISVAKSGLTGSVFSVVEVAEVNGYLPSHFERFLNFAASVELIAYQKDRTEFAIRTLQQEVHAIELLRFLAFKDPKSLSILNPQIHDLGIRTGIFASAPPDPQGLSAEHKQNVPRLSEYEGWIKNFVNVSSRLFEPSCLINSLQTGCPQWQNAFGVDVQNPFDLRFRNEPLFSNLMMGMHEATANEAAIIAETINLSNVTEVLDVGGASGALGPAFLDRYPNIETYAIYDLESAVPFYKSIFAATSTAPKVGVKWIGGDFFADNNKNCLAGLPASHQFKAIILGWILHDWADREAIAILRKVKAHLESGGRIFILEAVYSEELKVRDTYLDLTMMVQTGGKERTESQFEELLSSAQLKLRSISKTIGRRDVLEVTHV